MDGVIWGRKPDQVINMNNKITHQRRSTDVQVVTHAAQLLQGSHDTCLTLGENVDKRRTQTDRKPGHVFDVTRLLTRCPARHWGGCAALKELLSLGDDRTSLNPVRIPISVTPFSLSAGFCDDS